MTVKLKAYDVILSPVITEKSTLVSENNQVIFKVAPGATKTDIKSAVESLFKVGAPRVITDPNPRNSRAIRAYAKAGFKEIDRRITISGEALLMARDALPSESLVSL